MEDGDPDKCISTPCIGKEGDQGMISEDDCVTYKEKSSVTEQAKNLEPILTPELSGSCQNSLNLSERPQFLESSKSETQVTSRTSNLLQNMPWWKCISAVVHV